MRVQFAERRYLVRGDRQRHLPASRQDNMAAAPMSAKVERGHSGKSLHACCRHL